MEKSSETNRTSIIFHSWGEEGLDTDVEPPQTQQPASVVQNGEPKTDNTLNVITDIPLGKPPKGEETTRLQELKNNVYIESKGDALAIENKCKLSGKRVGYNVAIGALVLIGLPLVIVGGLIYGAGRGISELVKFAKEKIETNKDKKETIMQKQIKENEKMQSIENYRKNFEELSTKTITEENRDNILNKYSELEVTVGQFSSAAPKDIKIKCDTLIRNIKTKSSEIKIDQLKTKLENNNIDNLSLEETKSMLFSINDELKEIPDRIHFNSVLKLEFKCEKMLIEILKKEIQDISKKDINLREKFENASKLIEDTEDRIYKKLDSYVNRKALFQNSMSELLQPLLQPLKEGELDKKTSERKTQIISETKEIISSKNKENGLDELSNVVIYKVKNKGDGKIKVRKEIKLSEYLVYEKKMDRIKGMEI